MVPSSSSLQSEKPFYEKLHLWEADKVVRYSGLDFVGCIGLCARALSLQQQPSGDQEAVTEFLIWHPLQWKKFDCSYLACQDCQLCSTSSYKNLSLPVAY